MKVHKGKLNPDLKYWCFYLLAHFYITIFSPLIYSTVPNDEKSNSREVHLYYEYVGKLKG